MNTQLRLYFLFALFFCSSFAYGALKPVPPQTPPTRLVFTIKKVEFRSTSGRYHTYAWGNAQFDVVPKKPKHVAGRLHLNRDFPSGHYTAVRVTFAHMVGVTWSYFDSANSLFYYTSHHNNGKKYHVDGLYNLRKVSVISSTIARPDLVSKQYIPVPSGFRIDGFLRAADWSKDGHSVKAVTGVDIKVSPNRPKQNFEIIFASNQRALGITKDDGRTYLFISPRPIDFDPLFIE